MKDIFGIIGAAIALGGFFFGLYQYRLAQRWKRLEYAANLLQRFTSDPDLLLAITFLEYSKRDVHLPEKYRSLAKSDIFDHDAERLSRALNIEYERSAEYFIYLDVLSRLFEYLEQLYSFLEMKLIKPNDIKLVGYVLTTIANPRFIDKRSLMNFTHKNFPAVIKLMEIFGVQT